MEEVIRLSGYEINQVQIKKKGTQLLFTILLLLGLYTAAEKYQDIQEKQDMTGYGQGETAFMTETPDLQNLPADIFAMANMLNPPVELSETDLWKYQKPDVKDKENDEAVLQVAAAPETTVVPEMPLAQESNGSVTVPDEAAESGQQEIIPTVVTIQLYGNGGEPSVTTLTESVDAFFPEGWNVPFRLGKVFDGWYLDAACMVPFGGIEEGVETLELYAGWKELEGYVCNDAGYVVSCMAGSISDGILALPSETACVGIESGALAEVAALITEIYIPANISYIAPGALGGLPNLMYIEVAAGNPNYYSEGGILYTAAGKVAAAPVWYGGEE